MPVAHCYNPDEIFACEEVILESRKEMHPCRRKLRFARLFSFHLSDEASFSFSSCRRNVYAFPVKRIGFLFLSRSHLCTARRIAYLESPLLILARLGVIVLALHRRHRQHRSTCACRASSRHLARFECLRALPRGSGANDAQRGHSASLPFYASSIIPAKVIHPAHMSRLRRPHVR